MRLATMILSFVGLMSSVGLPALAGAGLPRGGYLTKDGKLTKPLKVLQLQGGCAGFTGVQYTIARDGSWALETVFNDKKTPKMKGKLTQKELMKLGALLEKFALAKLPAKSGKEPGANPHTIDFEFAGKKASLIGQMPPQLDPKNPTGTVESRFAGIWEGITALLTPPRKKEE